MSRRTGEPDERAIRALVLALDRLELASTLVREPALVAELGPTESPDGAAQLVDWLDERGILFRETRTAIERPGGALADVNVVRLNRAHPTVRQILGEGW
jgi:hypothetical protein